MADAKISALTAASTPLAGTEVVPVVQSGSTKKVSIDNLTKGRTVNATTFDTDVAAAGVTLSGTTLSADGTDTNIDINITPKGTGEVNITKVDIDGGAIDGVTIGTNSVVTDLKVDNLRLDGNTLSSTNTNGDVIINPDGSGNINLVVASGGKALVSAPIFQEAIARLSPAAGSGGTQSRIEFSDGDYQTGMVAAYGNVYGAGFNYAVMTASNTVNNTALGGTFQYSGAAAATRHWQQGGRHYLQYAASGSAGGTITWLTACSTTTSGNLAFPSGQGIDFSADGQATGMTSELLDDYEEGNWTPSVSCTTSGTIALSAALGFYTRVGRIVHVSAQLIVDSVASPNGIASIDGLPFASANNTNASSAVSLYLNGFAAGATPSVMGSIDLNSTNIYLFQFVDGNRVDTMANQFQAGARIHLSATYVAA